VLVFSGSFKPLPHEDFMEKLKHTPRLGK